MTGRASLAAVPLSAQLRAATASAHAAAEGSPYLSALAAGRVTAPGLAALLVRLVPVYDALEDAAGRWAGDPVWGRFAAPGLARGARLRADLRHLTGSADAPASPASAAYAARISDVAHGCPAAYVAHHCVRLLGDLSGGQVLRAALARSLGVTDGAGASFYAFPDVRVGEAKRAYRALLDASPFTAEQRDALVAEALVAYRHNVAVAAELDADLERWTAR